MLKRTLTGALIAVVVALAILSRTISIYFFDLFVMLVSFVATYEMVKLLLIKDKENSVPQKNISYAYLSLIYCYLIYMCYSLAKSLIQALIYQLVAFLGIFLIAFIIDLIYLAKLRKQQIEIEQKHVLNSTWTTLKLMLYPITLLGTLYGFGITGTSVSLGILLVVSVFAIAMLTDVFAYLFGMAFHKGVLASQISPKKSISGAIGGIFGGLLASAIIFVFYTYVFAVNPLVNFSLYKVILFFVLAGIFGSIFTQIGDLVASAIKRNAGIKDYGKIFPGHGGMMDRVDGLMFASTIILIISYLIFFI